jgi:hypothetical protein
MMCDRQLPNQMIQYMGPNQEFMQQMQEAMGNQTGMGMMQ